MARLDRAAALLTLRVRTAIATTTTAFAAITSATAATTPAALATVFAFAAWLAPILAALEGLATFTALRLIARTAIVTPVSALAAGPTTPPAAAAVSTVTGLMFASRVTRRATGLGRRVGIRLATKNPFQPADETARLFLRLGSWCAILLRLRRSRLELAFVATRFAWFKAARFTWISATFTRWPRLARLEGPALATLAIVAALP